MVKRNKRPFSTEQKIQLSLLVRLEIMYMLEIYVMWCSM